MNENNEIMLEEIVEVSEPIEVEIEVSETEAKSNVGGAVLLGAGIAAAGFAVYKLGKKAVNYFKGKRLAKKAAETAETVVYDDEDDDNVEE